MNTKHLPPAMVARRVLIAFFILAAFPLIAAPKKRPTPPTTAPTGASQTSARLRVWKTEFSSMRAIRIAVRAAAKSAAPAELGDFAGESRFGDYTSVPGGDAVIEVRADGEGGATLATYPARLPTDGWATLILRENTDGSLAFEVLDDKPTGDEASRELVVRNFVPDLKSLQVDAGPDLHLRMTSPDCYVHLRGLPREQLEVKTGAEDGAGTQSNWTNSVDLRQIRRATLLVLKDRAGRIRPRVVVDAPTPATSAASAPSPEPEAR